jgi:drug/metabolite transporter (DMT)-like permease
LNAATIGTLCALISALGFSIKAILVKHAYRYGVATETLLAMRMLYALPFFVLMAWYAHWRSPLRLTRDDLVQLAVLGFFGYYASSYCDFLGLQYISAALERVLLYTYPTMVVLMLIAWHRQAFAGRTAAALALSFSGVALAVFHDSRAANTNLPLGTVLVLASALSFAIYLFRCGPVLQRLGATRVTAWATGMACIIVIVQFALMKPVKTLPAQPLPVHLSALGMAIFCTVLPVWMNSQAVKRIGASRAAIIASTGPVFTLLLAWIFLGESLTATLLLGALLVIIGVRLIATQSMSNNKKETA